MKYFSLFFLLLTSCSAGVGLGTSNRGTNSYNSHSSLDNVDSVRHCYAAGSAYEDAQDAVKNSPNY